MPCLIRVLTGSAIDKTTGEKNKQQNEHNQKHFHRQKLTSKLKST